MKIINIEDMDKVMNSYSQEKILDTLNNRWNRHVTKNEDNEFFQINEYLNAIFNKRFSDMHLTESSEIKREFRDLKDDMYFDTEILLKDRSVTVYDISEISLLGGGKVIANLKSGKTEEVYTRNGYNRELMFANKLSEINLTRPGIEQYYRAHKDEYPWIQKLNRFFEALPVSRRLPCGKNSADVAELIYRKLNLNSHKLKVIMNEYRRFHKACGYQLCLEKYRGTEK